MATLSSHLYRWHRSFMRHISHDVGPRAALLYQEIRRCLGLKGGKTIDGKKWIWKTMQELADKFGFSVRDIQRHLKTLVDKGWLKREQLEAKQYKRRYWYSFGAVDPFCPVRERQAVGSVADKPAGSFLSSKNEQPGTGRHRRGEQSSEEQPYAIPGVDATARLIAEMRQWPGGLRDTRPRETHATCPAVGFG